MHPLIFNRREIEACLDETRVLSLIEEGFCLLSEGKVVVPPIGCMLFDDPKGEVHIKYGHIRRQDSYVIKIVSSFSSGNQGAMLIFCSHTGRLKAILHDEGYLTDIRTAAAGAIAAKYLAPKMVERIGIVGTGVQAFLQLLWLQKVVKCNEVIVWGRSRKNLERFALNPKLSSFAITPTQDLQFLTKHCNLIVTTTAANAPLLMASDIRPGTHITAVGADSMGKQELAADIFSIADIVAVDSKTQCFAYGDCKLALQCGTLHHERVYELGEIIAQAALRRKDDQQVTVADLTGVAIQDIQIATALFETLTKGAACIHSLSN